MAVLITCKFEDDPLKSEVAIASTTCSPLYVYDDFFYVVYLYVSGSGSITSVWEERANLFAVVNL